MGSASSQDAVAVLDPLRPSLLAQVDPIHEMNETWVGAACEFHDPEVQATFSDLRRVAGEFGSLVLERIYAMDRNPKMGWPKTDGAARSPVPFGALDDLECPASEVGERAAQFVAGVGAIGKDMAQPWLEVPYGIQHLDGTIPILYVGRMHPKANEMSFGIGDDVLA